MKESKKLGLRKLLMIAFLIGSISVGTAIALVSIYFAFDTYQLYNEHGIFGYGPILMSLTGIGVGISIPLFVVPLARIALNSIRNEKEILMKNGIEGLYEFRETNEAIYPKKFGLNKTKNIT
ncbi:hypothetical protein [Pelagicoccus mobilis]|uniref:Uncharacterized protein n=1 Tax=Pelagicoccus mobilis TaxID=415221 RepID=A0A934VUN6_9BACT|nr:hypothetical protein [Pelagicoccus mobilis]MBK1880699.1 hypothetical protein [Pelagicoccus mobilis]